MNNYFIAKGEKGGKSTLIRFDKSQFDKEKATELLNNNDVKNFFFFFEPAKPVEIDENTILFSGEVGFDITMDILLPYIKANKTIALNSVGGYNSEAMLIHDLVKDFYPNTKMLIMGSCFSATNQIFLSAKFENRQATQHSKFLIHNGWVCMEGDHNELRSVANMLEKETNTMIDLYMKVSEKPREEIVALMEAEAMLNTIDALEMNFISQVKKANNKSSKKNKSSKNTDRDNLNIKKTNNKMKDKGKALIAFNQMVQGFKKTFLSEEDVVNLILQDTEGRSLDFGDEIKDTSEIKVGSSVTVNGENQTLNAVMEDGLTYKIEKGKVAEIMQPENKISISKHQNAISIKDAEISKLQNSLKDKDVEIQDAKSESEAAKNELDKIKTDSVKMIKDFEEMKNLFETKQNNGTSTAKGEELKSTNRVSNRVFKTDK